jgi:hypothetical protein
MQDTLQAVNEIGVRRSLIQYYQDMGRFFINARRNSVANGRLIMIVGDTELRGAQIPNAYLLSEVAKRFGWAIQGLYERKVPAKILPTVRDKETGKFTSRTRANHAERYSQEYILRLMKVT